MSDELDVLKIVAARLDAAGIPYMISGSVAMNLYAQPRMTRDIDVVLDVGRNDVERLASLFDADFYCDRDMIQQAVEQPGMFNVIHTSTVVKVDLIVRKDTPYRRMELARRRPITVERHTVWVVAPEDLLLSKLAWAKDGRSETQLGDARNLIASVPDLDWAYLERWAPELTVMELLAEVRA